MKRRAFLATGVAVAAAGCLGRTGRGGGGGGGDSDPTTTNGGGDGDSTTTSGDGGSGGGSGDDAGCPDVSGDDSATTVCSGAAGGQPASFGQNADRVAVGEVVEVTLVNDAAESVGLNPYDWRVHRETGDGSGWERVERGPVVEPWVVLGAGDRARWRVGVGDAADPDTSPDDGVYGGTLPLESGRRYAFSVAADVDGDPVAFVAPFTVE